jgi:3-deoxy-D-manno-octulosonate 8-phosphate phosphatase (KDO 8-P phosphatase)
MSLKLVVFDVDGCMTNGAISYDSNGNEIKTFNVKDGLGIVTLHKMGIKTAIITGRDSSIVTNRVKELGITYLYQGVKKKIEKLDEILEKEGFKYSETAYIGDDINDVPILRVAGYSFAPKDALPYAKDAAKIVLSKCGGDGAVREMIEILLKECDLQERFKEHWV